MSVSLPAGLRSALPAAMKARDKTAVSVLRSTLAAIENAEAVAAPAAGSLAIEQIPLGVGAAEAERRELSEDDVAAIVRAEIVSRAEAADEYDRVGRPERAAQLRDEARVLTDFLG